MSRLQLLGPAHLVQESGAVPLAWHRPTALIAFLACQPGWVNRDELAAVLRADSGVEPARAYIRRLLYRLKELRLDEGVEVEPQRLRWTGTSDVREFVAACDARRWDEAVRLYRGRLLDGAGALGEATLDDWLDTERERIRARWRGALMALIDSLAVEDDRTRVAPLMQKLAEDDPLDEEATQFLLQRAGTDLERQVALAAYETLQRRMVFELALKPVAATQALAERLRTRVLPAAPLPGSFAPPPDVIGSAELTPFIGREAELLEIERLLRAPETRIVTLLGVGGVGKTRLARRVLELWRGRAAFVDLSQIDTEHALFDALSDAVALPASEGAMDARLGDWLAAHELLIVLDSFDQLVVAASKVAELAQRAPRVRWLITSREPTQVAGELRVELGGLPATTRDNGAQALFIRHAARHGYVLTAEDAQALERIAVAVDGSPLAIELAAHWVPVLTPDEIADEIERDLGILRSDAPALAPGHRSLRAVFDSSWRRLQPGAQRALCALSIFHGSFTRQAAAQVAAVDLSHLLELAGKSLVRRESALRYALHPLLRQFAAERLDADAGHRAQLRHARYFLAALAARRDLREGTLDPVAIAAVRADFDNVAGAWQYACENAEFESIESAFARLRVFLQQRRRNAAAIELYETALRVLPGDHALRDRLELARIQAWLDDGALEPAAAALGTLDPEHLTPASRFDYATARAILTGQRGDLKAAALASEMAMAAAEKADDPRQKAHALLNLATMNWSLGDPEAAEIYAQRAIAASEALGANLFLARAQRALSVLRRDQDRFYEARALLEASTKTFEAAGERHDVAYNLRQMSFLMTDRGDHKAQIDYALQALAAFEEIGARVPIAQTRFAVGFAYKQQGDLPRARDTLRATLREAMALDLMALVLRALVELGGLLARGRRELAMEAMLFAIDHPGVRAVDRPEFEERLAEINPGATEVAAARVRLRERTLATLSALVLAA